jgi:tetratricopeptide (TPR) repeat protein
VILLQQGRAAAGADELRTALRLEPGSAETQYNLMLALNECGQWAEAAALGEKLAKSRPTDANAAAQWGRALAQQKKTKDALSAYAHALLLDQNLPDALNGMAWILSTDPHPEFRNGPEAVGMALRASDLSGGTNAEYLMTLAAAYAETGRFNDAVVTTQSAHELAQAKKQAEIVVKSELLLETFRSNRAFRTGQN